MLWSGHSNFFPLLGPILYLQHQQGNLGKDEQDSCTQLLQDLWFGTFVCQALLYSPEHPSSVVVKVPPLLGKERPFLPLGQWP